jgi:hypothetical protein
MRVAGVGDGPLSPPHVGDFTPVAGVRWVVTVVAPVWWAWRGLGGALGGRVKCRYLYGPVEGGQSCHCE